MSVNHAFLKPAAALRAPCGSNGSGFERAGMHEQDRSDAQLASCSVHAFAARLTRPPCMASQSTWGISLRQYVGPPWHSLTGLLEAQRGACTAHDLLRPTTVLRPNKSSGLRLGFIVWRTLGGLPVVPEIYAVQGVT